MATYTFSLSGPRQRQPALAKTIEAEGLTVEPDGYHSHGLPPGDESWLTVLGDDVDHVVGVAEGHGWALRNHWTTPAGGNVRPEKPLHPLDWLTSQGVTPAEFRKWMEG
jgi:hypothetical protein